MVTDYKHGGYNFDDNEIGVALMTAAVFQLVWQVELLFFHGSWALVVYAKHQSILTGLYI